MSVLLVLLGGAGSVLGLIAILKGSLVQLRLSSRLQGFAFMGIALTMFLGGAAMADPIAPVERADTELSTPFPVRPPQLPEPEPEPEFEVEAQEASSLPPIASPPASGPPPSTSRTSATAPSSRRAASSPPQPAAPACDPAYPDFCIAPRPPDLDCADIGVNNFTVLPPDPHRFDADHDGKGCDQEATSAGPVPPRPAPPPPASPAPAPIQSACSDGIDNDGDDRVDMADPGCSGATDNNEIGPVAPPPPPPPNPPASSGGGCDPSYPGVCIPPAPPDLDCPQIQYRNFSVLGADPHGFDADNDGIGCEQ